VSEADWIDAARKGDLNSFNLLVLAHQQAAYDLAVRMLRDEAAAADATQDAFLAAFTHIRQFRGSSFRAWLMRIVLNRVYDRLRARTRHDVASLDTLGDDEETPALRLADDAPGPEQAVLSAELRSCIEKGLQLLSPEQRATVVLCDIHGLSYEEIAVATHASLGTVKSRLSRARAALRSYLSRHVELLPDSVRHYFERAEVDPDKTATAAKDG